MDILSDSDYKAIRKAIHYDFNETNLKDDGIADSAVTTDAETELAARGIVYADLSADNKAIAKRGLILLAASYLAPAVRGIVSLNSNRDGVSYSVPAFSGEKRAIELLERANTLLTPLVPSGTKTAERPTLFAVASSRRGA